jgi:hypothetical protein
MLEYRITEIVHTLAIIIAISMLSDCLTNSIILGTDQIQHELVSL